MNLLVKFAAGFAGLYVLVVLLIALAQDWLLFPRWAMGHGGAALPASAERLALEAPSGEELVGVHLPAEVRPSADSALILGFGGNAWNADTLAVYLHSVFPDRDVVAFHYRGYAPSTGRPSAAAILQDSLSVHDHVVATLSPGRIMAVGLSIGAGPAAYLASQRPVAGLILVTPFDSLKGACARTLSVGPRRSPVATPDGDRRCVGSVGGSRGTDRSREGHHRSASSRCADRAAMSCWIASSWAPVTTISTTETSSSAQCGNRWR